MNDLKNLNELLAGVTFVRSIRIDIEPVTYAYNMLLVMGKHADLDEGMISVCFKGVSNLNLPDFGGGLTQFMWLQISHLDAGLDRIKYSLADLENESIFCHFYSVTLLTEQADSAGA
ncbi:hypothetical protein [Kiloniella laminariae]|uniref:hypothetical protein n=1 Tax=Kiloniella laminariae TaxID=454162 RepID=UPI00035D68D8|nr:hypothetical protein [Kiloniella laminariae]